MKQLSRFFVLLILALVGIPYAIASCLNAPSGTTGRAFKTTGDPSLDSAINGEAGTIASAFGVTPQLYTLDDSQSSNAYADCNNNRVFIGLRLLREELWSMDKGTLAVAGIMAHEFTHIYQCAVGGTLTGSKMELQADYMAGWYMRHAKSSYGLDISGFARSLWQKGDYNFRDPTHHGTPTQRVGAMAEGFNNNTSSASQAFEDSVAYLTGGDGGGYLPDPYTKSTKTCECKVTCTHLVECTHRTSCTHMTTTTQIIVCQHPIMTPYGLMPAHPNGDIMPMTVPAHDYDVAHPGGDFVHPYDIAPCACTN